MSQDTSAQHGWALLELGRGVEAERQFRGALATDPGDAELHFGLARAYLLQKRRDEAKSSVHAGLRQAPTHPFGLFLLGGIALDEGDKTAARAANDQLLEMAPEWSVAHDQRGVLELSDDRPGVALTAFDYALRMAPDSAGIHLNRALALSELGRRADAEQALDTALRLEPDNPRAHHVRSILMVRHTWGGREAALASREALRRNPTDEGYRTTAAVAAKTRNPVYRWLLRYSMWLGRLSPGQRIAVIIGLVIAARIFPPLLIVLVLSWAVEPLMNAALLAAPSTRALVGREERRATLVFGVLLIGAVAAAIIGVRTGVGSATAAAFGLLLWGLVAGSVPDLEGRRRMWVRWGVPAAAALGVAAVTLGLAGQQDPAMVAAGALAIGGLVTMWVVALRR